MNLDHFHQRYLRENKFNYSKFINLEQTTYDTHKQLGDINLVIQTYPIKLPEKLEELLLCLHNNLNNKCIKKIYNLYEGHIDFLPDFIKNNEKLINIKIQKSESEYKYTHVPDFNKFNDRFSYIKQGLKNGGIDEKTDKSLFVNNIKDRMTWNYFITFCSETFKDDEIICLANSDIILEDSFEWYSVSNLLNDNIALCLSRHEINKEGDVFIDFSAFKCWSQDCWVFKKSDKMKKLLNNNDFSIGMCMGCDNVIAGIAFLNNYIPLNYAFKYRIFHLDRVTKVNNNQVYLSISHDSRIMENFNNFPNVHMCPFLNYEKLLLSSSKDIVIDNIINSKKCVIKEYHIH
jgi:hypothetical protein